MDSLQLSNLPCWIKIWHYFLSHANSFTAILPMLPIFSKPSGYDSQRRPWKQVLGFVLCGYSMLCQTSASMTSDMAVPQFRMWLRRTQCVLFWGFKHLRTNNSKDYNFIWSLIKPVLLYNFELWYNTLLINRKKDEQRGFLLNSFDLDMDFCLESCGCKAAANVIEDSICVLYSRY